MNKTLTLTLILCLSLGLALLSGCGDGDGDKKTGGDDKKADSGGDDKKDGGAKAPTAADRDAFVGTWKGKYSGLDDEMVIEKGEGDLDVMVTLHSSFENPDKVPGTVTASDTVTITDQTLGGAKGSAVIKIADGKLTLEQSGLGTTVKGEGYEKQ